VAVGRHQFSNDAYTASRPQYVSRAIYGALGTSHGCISGRSNPCLDRILLCTELDYQRTFSFERLERVIKVAASLVAKRGIGLAKIDL